MLCSRCYCKMALFVNIGVLDFDLSWSPMLSYFRHFDCFRRIVIRPRGLRVDSSNFAVGTHSLSARSGSFFHYVMLTAFVLYGMTLSWNHVINVFKFQKVFLFFKSQVFCGFMLYVCNWHVMWVLGSIVAAYMKTYTIVRGGFIGRNTALCFIARNTALCHTSKYCSCDRNTRVSLCGHVVRFSAARWHHVRVMYVCITIVKLRTTAVGERPSTPL
jgi:hypothetical protein